MHIHQRISHYFVKHRTVRTLAAQAIMLSVIGLGLVSNLLGGRLSGAFAQSPCSTGDLIYTVKSGDTLGGIANHYHISWQKLTKYNHIANPNFIYQHELVCIPGHSSKGNSHGKQPGHKPKSHGGNKNHRGGHPAIGYRNTFPYGQCTWWADQRFYQLHHVFVPWNGGNAEAWQWANRAYDFHWRVSYRPSVGAIMDLQPGVQGAWGTGHVAVVERVLRNGHVIASNMNWGRAPYEVVNVEFVPGPGITFITY